MLYVKKKLSQTKIKINTLDKVKEYYSLKKTGYIKIFEKSILSIKFSYKNTKGIEINL